MTTETDQYTDAEIIRRILEGDKFLFEILIRRYNSLLYKTGRSYNYNHHDTMDLMQDTFMDAFSSLAGFEFRSAFKTWLLRIMLNNCFRKQQKSGYKKETHVDLTENFQAMSADLQNDDVNRTFINRELGHIIEKALLKIPLDYRIVFSLREISGMDVQETAEILKISQANVKTRLNRAKSMLRKEVVKFYTPGEIFEFNLVYCDEMVNRIMKRIVTI